MCVHTIPSVASLQNTIERATGRWTTTKMPKYFVNENPEIQIFQHRNIDINVCKYHVDSLFRHFTLSRCYCFFLCFAFANMFCVAKTKPDNCNPHCSYGDYDFVNNWTHFFGLCWIQNINRNYTQRINTSETIICLLSQAIYKQVICWISND